MKLTENTIADLSIRITDKLVAMGYVPDCTDTDDQSEFEVQDIIRDILEDENLKPSVAYYEKINDLAHEYFGKLTFEDLELIFDVQLFGLSETDTEAKLKELQQEWFELEWQDVLSIMAEFDKEIE